MSAVDSRRVVVRVDIDADPTTHCRTESVLVERLAQTVWPLLEHGNRVILLGRRGRPVIGPRDTFPRIRANNPDLQFGHVAAAVGSALGIDEPPTPCSMPTVQIPGYALGSQLTVLENLAFDPREARNDQVLARQLAALGDRYIIDDIRALNDRSSSIASMPKAIPTQLSIGARGELAELDQLLTSPVHPLVALIGGGQVALKLDVLRRLGPAADELLVTGEVANTFLAARGVEIKRTIVDSSQIDAAKQLGGLFENKLTLPTDFVWRMGRIMDIGPQTRARFAQSIAQAGSILFAGPAGVVSLQLEAFHHGTISLAEAVGANLAAQRIVIGDETIDQLPPSVLASGIHRAGGNDVALQYLATGKLVALDAINASRFSLQSEPATLPTL